MDVCIQPLTAAGGSWALRWPEAAYSAASVTFLSREAAELPVPLAPWLRLKAQQQVVVMRGPHVDISLYAQALVGMSENVLRLRACRGATEAPERSMWIGSTISARITSDSSDSDLGAVPSLSFRCICADA